MRKYLEFYSAPGAIKELYKTGRANIILKI